MMAAQRNRLVRFICFLPHYRSRGGEDSAIETCPSTLEVVVKGGTLPQYKPSRKSPLGRRAMSEMGQ